MRGQRNIWKIIQREYFPPTSSVCALAITCTDSFCFPLHLCDFCEALPNKTATHGLRKRSARRWNPQRCWLHHTFPHEERPTSQFGQAYFWGDSGKRRLGFSNGVVLLRPWWQWGDNALSRQWSSERSRGLCEDSHSRRYQPD